MFCKKGIPRNFAKFSGKQLCQSPFSESLDKVSESQACNFIEIHKQAFSGNFNSVKVQAFHAEDLDTSQMSSEWFFKTCLQGYLHKLTFLQVAPARTKMIAMRITILNFEVWKKNTVIKAVLPSFDSITHRLCFFEQMLQGEPSQRCVMKLFLRK